MNRNPYMAAFEEFTTRVAEFAASKQWSDGALEAMGVYGNEEFQMTDRKMVGKIYHQVVKFLNDNALYHTNPFSTSFETSTPGAAAESINAASADLSKLHTCTASLYELTAKAMVPTSMRAQLVQSLGKMISSYAKGPMAAAQHWTTERHGVENLRDATTIYPASALNDVSFGPNAGMEAFGATIDTVIPDLRMAMTIVLLRPHRSIISRLMHRRTAASTVVQYVIPYDELYDLVKSQDADGTVRQSHEHRVPILQLYRKPDPANMTLVPIIPMKSNDISGVLVDDGIIKFGNEVNLFDLSTSPTKIGFKNHNYTDLVSDGVIFEKVYFTLTNNATPAQSETFVADVSTRPVCRLTMLMNNADSGDRAATGPLYLRLTKDTKTSAGAANTLLSIVDGTDEIMLVVRMAAHISLKSAIASAVASAKLEAVTNDKNVAVSQDVKDLVAGLKVSLDGYSLDAKFSEENLRKTSLSVRTATRTVGYEIPVGRSIVVDYSMQQTIPEHILSTAQEIQSIGIDYRDINIFIKMMRDVHDRCRTETGDSMFVINSNGRRINDEYVSGTRINPYIHLGTLGLNDVANMRSADMLGDVRQYVESKLNKIISNLHLNSLIVQQLDLGEIPTYKVLTSGPIIENLFSIPHIHNHLMPQGLEGERVYSTKTPGEPVEYTRVLPSGVLLQCITTTFTAFQDKILIVPVRPNNPESEINFGHNWDFGSFVAHYTPVDQNQVNKRVFQNSREWPIVTCPVGIILDVQGLNTVLPDVSAITG